MQGVEVAALQQRLIELGYLTGEATDYFGSETKSALAAFQNQNGLQGDGIAGEKTLVLLNSDKAKKCDPFSLLAPTVNMSFEELVRACYEHHERMDGSGYPQRLKGNQISRVGRITAIADSFSAMICDRPYSERKDP